MQTNVIFIPTGNAEYAKEVLEATEPLTPFYSRIWIPKKNTYWRKDGRFELIRKTLFPSYLFIDTESFEDLHCALMDYSYTFPTLLLGSKDEVALRTVTDEELAWINAISGEKISEVKYINQRVHFVRGPMIGMDGFVKKVDRHKRQLMLEIEFFQRTMKIWTAFDEVAFSPSTTTASPEKQLAMYEKRA